MELWINHAADFPKYLRNNLSAYMHKLSGRIWKQIVCRKRFTGCLKFHKFYESPRDKIKNNLKGAPVYTRTKKITQFLNETVSNAYRVFSHSIFETTVPSSAAFMRYTNRENWALSVHSWRSLSTIWKLWRAKRGEFWFVISILSFRRELNFSSFRWQFHFIQSLTKRSIEANTWEWENQIRCSLCRD